MNQLTGHIPSLLATLAFQQSRVLLGQKCKFLILHFIFCSVINSVWMREFAVTASAVWTHQVYSSHTYTLINTHTHSVIMFLYKCIFMLLLIRCGGSKSTGATARARGRVSGGRRSRAGVCAALHGRHRRELCFPV